MFGLQLHLTCNPWTNLSNPCNKMRGKILLKKSPCVFLHASFIPASVFVTASLLLCRYDVVDEYITRCALYNGYCKKKKKNGPSNLSSNPWQDCLHFTLMPPGKAWIYLFFFQLQVHCWADGIFTVGAATHLGRRKLNSNQLTPRKIWPCGTSCL